MPTIYIDNKPYQVKKGQNLLQAGLSLKLDIPYFCWHPALGSVGACRLCAVKQFKDEEDTQGKLVMACMTPAQDNSYFSIADPEAREFRRAVLEWLMVNHPHDCPICDEGGECHLQDMTVMTGHTYREFRFKKRTHRNQYLGPLINHEMNRCIQCYRCVRFYNDYAGSDDLKALAAHDHVYFGRHQDGVLESEFSGNLVEVCPTGVFTDKTLKQHYTRKWDLQTAPSICVYCGVGCNTIPGERYGMLRRIRNRYNGQVNRYFLCDRGRYGYEFVNSERRIRHITLHDDAQAVAQAALGRPNGQEDEIKHPERPGRLTPTPSAQDAPATRKAFILQRLQSILEDSAGVIGIGSPRASLEANFALRQLVGPDNFYAGLSARDYNLLSQVINILQSGSARSPSLSDIEHADAVLVLGEDVTNTAPRMALALRQSVRQQPLAISRALDIPDWQDAAVREAIQQEKGPLFIATPSETKLDAIATDTYHAAPDDIARLGFAIAHALDAEAPLVLDLTDDLQSLAKTIAQALSEAERPLVVSGVSLGNEMIIQAAANVAWALCRKAQLASLAYTVPDNNSLGLGLLSEHSLSEAVEAVRAGQAETVIILENDLYRRTDPDTVETLFDQAEQVIVLDHLTTLTTTQADVVLPAATFVEGTGTLVNAEGRAQRFYQVFSPEGDIQASWRWLAELMYLIEPERKQWANLDEVMAALAETLPIFEPILDIAPPADFRMEGQRLPRQPHRYSGRTAMQANRTVHEPKPPEDEDTPLVFSMEGYRGQPPPAALVREYWRPGWNSVQALNKFQSEVGGPLHGGDPGRRLIEPIQTETITYFDQRPPAFEPRHDEWLVVPLYHIFGSEPLSMLAPGIAELAPQPYLGLNPADAQTLQLEAGHLAVLTFDDTAQQWPVKYMPSLPKGVAGLPVGLPEMPTLQLPEWGRIRPVE